LHAGSSAGRVEGEAVTNAFLESTPVAATTGRVTKTRLYLSFWLFVLSSISFLDRTNIAIAGTQLSNEFHLGNQQLGWVFSAFLVGYAGFQIPAGLLAVRFGPRRVITTGVSVWALCNVLTAMIPPGYVHAIVLLFAVRCALGIAEAVIYPAANQFVARWIPQKERGFVNGLIFAGVGAGSMVAPPLLTWIILNHGWRSAFWVDASLGICGALVWWFIARDRPEEHPRVSAAEQQEIREGLTSFATTTATAKHVPERKVSWRALFSRIDLPALMVSYFALGYTSWVFFSWFYLYMAQARGLNLKTSAVFSMMPFACMTLFCLAGGFTSDFLSRTRGLRTGRCFLASASMFCTALFLITGSRVADAFTAAVFLSLGAGCLYFCQSTFWSVSSDLAGKNSGVFSSIMNMSCQIGGALTASLTPWLAAHYDWKMPFAVAGSLVFLGSLSWLLVHPERPIEV
jgi:ACS family glucarate transporter-like MFS transporter